MKFNSLKEYFYKLQIRGYQFMMLPLIVLIFAYLQTLTKFSFILFDEDTSQLILVVFSGYILVALVILDFVIKGYVKRIIKLIGLGIKLEKIGTLISVKLFILAFHNLLAAICLLVTNNIYFALLFVLLLIWYFLQWTTPASVCKILQLKGDEREMIISRGDAFK
jgi:hypothetical protein